MLIRLKNYSSIFVIHFTVWKIYLQDFLHVDVENITKLVGSMYYSKNWITSKAMRFLELCCSLKYAVRRLENYPSYYCLRAIKNWDLSIALVSALHGVDMTDDLLGFLLWFHFPLSRLLFENAFQIFSKSRRHHSLLHQIKPWILYKSIKPGIDGSFGRHKPPWALPKLNPVSVSF